MNKRKKCHDRLRDPIRGEVHATYQTQAISDASSRAPKTNVAIPDEVCVDEAKDWVDFNEK